MATPCCPKCSSQNIGSSTETFNGETGVLLYCNSCGAILAWSIPPDK